MKFDDPATERDYREAVARAMRTPYRFASALGAIVAVLAWFTDRTVQITDANIHVVRLFRIVWLFPAMALIVAFGYTPMRWFRRGFQLALAAGFVTVFGMNAIAATVLPDPAVIDVRTAMISVVLMTMASAMVSIPYRIVIAIALVGNVAISAAILVRWPESSATSAMLFWQAAGVALAGFSAYLFERRDRAAFLAARLLAAERARTRELLHNTLPPAIADRLEAGAARIADHFDDATVLFADIVGFTPLASKLAPAELVAALDDVFTELDTLAERHGLEKIKTIGDAYMVVGGVPTARADHASAVAEMALAMRDAVARRTIAGVPLALRIGIHSGPLVAGVIGKRKFLYDLWGDTVNLASRLESHGLPGEIQVSGETRTRLGERFTLTSRGKVSIKGKGELETWLLISAS